MVGGGYGIDVVSGDLRVVESYPSDTNTWTVTGVNNTSGSVTLTAYAICATTNQSLGITIQASAPTTISKNTSEGATATCPTGRATGGGFRLPPDSTAYVIASQPRPDRDGWTASAYNPSSSDVTEYAYAMCATSTAVYVAPIESSSFTVSQGTSTISGGQSTIPSSACKKDYQLTGGGFSIDTKDAKDDTMMHVQLDNGMSASGALTQWDIAAYNNDTTNSHSGKVYAVCMLIYVKNQ